jgi:FkbM family methyltransferase
MLLRILLSVVARRPGLGFRLLSDALRDRFGRHQESSDVHLLDVMRFVAREGGRVSFDGADHLLIELTQKGRFRLRLRDSDVRVFREVFVHEEYQAALDCIRKGRAEPWIIDAGANIGLVTLYLTGRCPAARVVALEPDPANAEQFRWHVAHNSAGRVRLVEAALWPIKTRLRMVREGEQSWGIRVEASEDGPLPAVSPLDLIRDHGIDQIDLLKLDVEGSEFPLMNDPDCHQWLSRVRAIIAEIHPDLGDAGRLRTQLIQAGFTVRDVGAGLIMAER